jgi:cation diffusion facilitator CzcD-associated flavoprotein CzcO
MHKITYQWAIIGAGPAGIAAVGKLIDQGVPPSLILWIDPYFEVGDLGRLWSNVSSNTTVQLFNAFLHEVKSFQYANVAAQYALTYLPAEATCLLSHIVKPLQWVSNTLQKQVSSVRTTIHAIRLKQRLWDLISDTHTYTAHHVILATGAAPSVLNYPAMDVIPFDLAIDKQRLENRINSNHTVGVFGSSHSAIIIIRHLVELGIKRVINFYRSPLKYAIQMDDWILFDNTGLKGETAAWARAHIDGHLPKNLERYHADEHHISHHLPICNQVIYAVGFEPRHTRIMGDYEHAVYNPHMGIIGPGLFGLGIAYPEIKEDRFGTVESQVGLWKFMMYLNKVLPLWFKYPA